MFKNNFLAFLLFIFFILHSNANEKELIISKLNSLESLKFAFKQKINDQLEQGICLLEFPGKLKCEYSDIGRKELIINKNKLAITKKKYNNTYHYPISESPFINILYKKELLKMIYEGKLIEKDGFIKLIYINKNKIIVLFDSKNYDLKGWEILDDFNNKIVFNLDILSKNIIFDKDTFKIPEIN